MASSLLNIFNFAQNHLSKDLLYDLVFQSRAIYILKLYITNTKQGRFLVCIYNCTLIIKIYGENFYFKNKKLKQLIL